MIETRTPIAERVFYSPRGEPVTVFLREDTSDHNIAQSCLTQDQYGFRDLDLVGTALDVGAHIGTAALALVMDHPRLSVRCLEPLPANRELIVRNAQINGVVDRIEVIEGMAGRSGKGTVDYNFTDNEHGRHNAYVAGVGRGSHSVHEVRSYALGELLDPPICLLKIDCEGGEWDFFDSPDVERVPLIIGEWHPRGNGSRERLTAYLSPHDIAFDGPLEGPGPFRAALRV